MACYNVFADLSWSDFTEAQQLDSANPPSFVDHLTNANFLNDPFLIDFPDLALPLNFHQGFFQVSDSPRTLSKLEENTSMATSHESITVEDRQISNLGEKHELKAHTDLLQHIFKAKPLGQDDGHKLRVSGDVNTTICEFKINQAELEYAERLGDPSVALFLEHHLGFMKWHIFIENRVDKGKSSEQQKASIIDFLVKTEIIKEVFRKLLPPAYSEVNYAVHTWSKSPNGRIVLTRANVFTLSGWSKAFFSYWSRRAEHLALFSLHDDRLRIIGSELERRLSQDCHDLDFTTNTVVQSLIQMTTRKLDAVLKMTKDRTGLNPTKLRGKHSILDAYVVAKDRFLASNHSTSRSSAASPLGHTSDSRRYDPISSVINPVSPNLSAHLESSLVSSSKNLRRNAKSTPGRSVFKLQHTVVPAVEVSEDQLDFQFEWQMN
ncbi:uncharacterized protein C8R40DRAFT_1067777 [Lentinula edodes]|uniref:uncharacterized protein n=1 Tax=Lentinula edodes TaxID=5353 RepID=UPI001E8E1E8C|nr:uncharacterized protein C8R40DRAFT_1067777 [Lentinula edodes]KAH7877588.1 hypothetical protein C8R40DRAFT_1067777 [Lentinula edodes]